MDKYSVQGGDVSQAEPSAAAGSSSGSGGGLPWGKILAGCGCLGIVAIAVLGVGGFFGLKAFSGKADEAGVTDLVEAFSEEGTSGGEGDGVDPEEAEEIRQEARESKERALDEDRLRSYLREPLTKRDVRRHVAFVEGWRDHPKNEEWREQYEKAEKLDEEDPDSLSGAVKATGTFAKLGRLAAEVMEAFDAYVQDEGGYEDYYGRMVRIAAVNLAAQAVADADSELDDPYSDETAEAMLEERPKVREEYEKNFDEAREAIQEAKKRKESGQQGAEGTDPAAMAAMSGVFQNPGTVALARAPEESFETWRDMSAEERKELRKVLEGSIAPGQWFDFYALNTTGVLMTAYAAEIEELEGELEDE
ncbi:MAG: hypothetical protein ACOCV2_07970 [Persicimonas sp.]